MHPELEITESEELGYYIKFDKLFPNLTPYLQKTEKDQLIEVNFSFTDEETEPSETQLAASKFLLENADQMLENVLKYLKKHEEYFMEFYGPYTETSYQSKGFRGQTFTSTNKHGFPSVDDMYELINFFGIGKININDAGLDDMACVGFTGGCTWDEEHGFGAAFYKEKLLEVGDWNVGDYVSWNPEDAKEITNEFVDFHGLESLEERKKRLAKLSATIQVEKPEENEEIFDWLVAQKMIYGYRNTPVDLSIKEKVVVLNEIKKLSFYGNEIETVPSSIQLLKNLTSLSFSFNNLVAIPIQIYKLTTLEKLIISSNELERIPKQIRMLKNLTHLSLNRNKLQLVTEKIGELPKLQHLDLSSNKLDQLPSSILELTTLEKLFLNYNSFANFPENIVNLKSLKTLQLATNQLTSIPETISQLQLLEQLDLRFNELTVMPESILTKKPNLKWLQINVNQFSLQYLEDFKSLIPEEMKTDIDSTIAGTKDRLRRAAIHAKSAQKQQTSEKVQQPSLPKTSTPKTAKQRDKKWWEFWRKK